MRPKIWGASTLCSQYRAWAIVCQVGAPEATGGGVLGVGVAGVTLTPAPSSGSGRAVSSAPGVDDGRIDPPLRRVPDAVRTERICEAHRLGQDERIREAHRRGQHERGRWRARPRPSGFRPLRLRSGAGSVLPGSCFGQECRNDGCARRRRWRPGRRRERAHPEPSPSRLAEVGRRRRAVGVLGQAQHERIRAVRDRRAPSTGSGRGQDERICVHHQRVRRRTGCGMTRGCA